MELTAAYRRLVEVVRLVASPPEVQLAALPEWTCRGDEIALLFHEEMLTVRLLVESGAVSSQGLAVLKEIDRRFDEMSGELNAELWTDSAVRTRPEWQGTRVLAQEALSMMGETLQAPDLSHVRYARGQ